MKSEKYQQTNSLQTKQTKITNSDKFLPLFYFIHILLV